MVKMVSLKRTAAEKKADNSAEGRADGYETEDGADLHLDGSHLKKMDEKGETTAPISSLPHGHEVHFEGHGTIHRTSDGPEGGRVHIKVHRLGADYDDPKGEREEGSVRDNLERSAEASERKTEAKEKAKEARRSKESERKDDE